MYDGTLSYLEDAAVPLLRSPRSLWPTSDITVQRSLLFIQGRHGYSTGTKAAGHKPLTHVGSFEQPPQASQVMNWRQGR